MTGNNLKIFVFVWKASFFTTYLIVAIVLINTGKWGQLNWSEVGFLYLIYVLPISTINTSIVIILKISLRLFINKFESLNLRKIIIRRHKEVIVPYESTIKYLHSFQSNTVKNREKPESKRQFIITPKEKYLKIIVILTGSRK